MNEERVDDDRDAAAPTTVDNNANIEISPWP